jgi:hypothetical protein
MRYVHSGYTAYHVKFTRDITYTMDFAGIRDALYGRISHFDYVYCYQENVMLTLPLAITYTHSHNRKRVTSDTRTRIIGGEYESRPGEGVMSLRTIDFRIEIILASALKSNRFPNAS